MQQQLKRNTRRPSRGHGQAGFTLVELMVVIAILAILASVVGVNVIGAFGRGNQSAAKTQIQSLRDAVVMYKLEHRKLPPDLGALVNNSKRNYLNQSVVPKDPWGADYLYQQEGSKFRIISYGADGSQGGQGEDADIDSDNMQEE